ncbi:ribosome maturation factor RimM [Ilumatobacter sp.]|uniref:ribosome maturation factor RimM n=1 Tax=Ilumatobacter sp. TaxID=1967498 RepID=UPI003C32614F
MRPSGRNSSPPDGWLAVGHLRRPHGLKGDIFVQLTTDRRERVAPGAEFFARDQLVSVVASRVAGNGRIIARFEHIPDRTEAERWTNVELFAAPIDDPSALWVHEMIGLRVVDQHGVDRGSVTTVLANPAAEILETDVGALVPTNFVVGVADGVITVDAPDGLFELNDD